MDKTCYAGITISLHSNLEDLRQDVETARRMMRIAKRCGLWVEGELEGSMRYLDFTIPEDQLTTTLAMMGKAAVFSVLIECPTKEQVKQCITAGQAGEYVEEPRP